jgi:hypothetical protein
MTPGGSVLVTRSSSFGYYRIDGLSAGQTVIVSAKAKGLVFDPIAISPVDDIFELDLIAQP